MKVEKELFKKYLKWMFGCSIAVMLLNPACLFLFPFSVIFYVFYLIPYVVVGTPVWYLLRDRAWMLQTLAIWLSSNAVLVPLFFFLWDFLMKPEGEGAHGGDRSRKEDFAPDRPGGRPGHVKRRVANVQQQEKER